MESNHHLWLRRPLLYSVELWVHLNCTIHRNRTCLFWVAAQRFLCPRYRITFTSLWYLHDVIINESHSVFSNHSGWYIILGVGNRIELISPEPQSGILTVELTNPYIDLFNLHNHYYHSHHIRMLNTLNI